MVIRCYLPEPYGGTGLYRIRMPHEIMNHDVVITSSSDYDSLCGDIMIVSKAHFVSVIPILDRLRSGGTRCIVDFDDYWALPQEHLLYGLYKKNDTTNILISGLRAFDYVTCTTDLLANEIRKINPNVAVFPNAINPILEQYKAQLNPHDGFHFGWLGGQCHLQDISLLESVSDKLNARVSDWNVLLFGHDGQPNSIYNRFANILSSGGKTKDKLLVYRAASANTYTLYYNLLDSCLIPLADTRFNSMKSELKLIEAAHFSKAAIVSNVYPYKPLLTDSNSMVVNNKSDWVKHMARLVKNPSLAADLGAKLHEDMKDRFNVWNVSKDRESFYQSIL